MSGIAGQLKRLRLSEDTVRPVPCFGVLFFYLSTALPLGLLAFGYVVDWQCWTLMVGALASGLVLLPPRRGHIVAAALGLIIAGLHAAAPWRTYERIANEVPTYVGVQAIVIDEKVPASDALNWLDKPRNIRVKVSGIRLSPRAEWEPCSGVIILQNPSAACTYGAKVEIQGTMMRPPPASLPGNMDYRNYLKTRGIEHLLRATSITVRQAEPQGWRRTMATLFKAREAAVVRMLKHVKNEQNRDVLAAMTVGMRQGLNNDTRTTYIRSGMIHLFAISGLHVGILFAILLGLATLCRVPFSLRYLTLPIILIVYVAATGSAPSAMRAWLMLTVWSVGRGLKRPVVATNTILVAALALLLFNPYSIFHSGFQFSFVIVLCLIWGWQRGRVLMAVIEEQKRWVPASVQDHNSLANRLMRFLSKAVMSMACAWLGGIGLTAFYNGLFLPMAILTNTLVCLGASVIIGLALLQLVVSVTGIDILQELVTWVLERCLDILRSIADIGAEFGGVTAVPTPSLWMVALYYGLLLLFFSRGLVKPQRALLGLATAVCVGLMISGIGRRHEMGEAVVFVAADDVTPVVLVNNLPQGPILINTGGKRFGRVLGNWLAAQGIDELETVVILDNTVEYYGGLSAISQKAPPRNVALLARSKRAIDGLEKVAWACNSRLSVSLRDAAKAGALVTVKATRRSQEDMSYEVFIGAVNPVESVRVLLDVNTIDGSRVHVSRPAVEGSGRELAFRYSRVDRVVVVDDL